MIPKPIETAPDEDVLAWRRDQKCWVIVNIPEIKHWFGNPELAYTHWHNLPQKMN